LVVLQAVFSHTISNHSHVFAVSCAPRLQVFAELVYNARKSLKVPQVVRLCDTLTCIANSPGLQLGTQALCLRVLLALTEALYPIIKDPNVDSEGKLRVRTVVQRLLDCPADRLKALHAQVRLPCPP
jgi:hypothetical protein